MTKKKRIYSRYNYYQPCKCEACYGDTNWHDVIAIRIPAGPGQNAVQRLFGRKGFMYVCFNCFREQEAHRHDKR